MLDVDDLLDAYDAAVANVDRTAGEVFNVGGGPGNTISIWAEFGPLLESLIGREVPIDRRAGVAGDQRWYVSDIGKLSTMTGWRPTVGVARGARPGPRVDRPAPRRRRRSVGMRVLLAMTYFRPYVSGPIIYAENLARELRRRGHDVTILTARYEPGLAAEEVVDGIRVVRVPVAGRVSKGVVMPTYPRAAWRALREHDVVAIQVPQFEAPLLAALARAARRARPS